MFRRKTMSFKDLGMTRTPVEIGQSFHKTGSPYAVWTLDGFNNNTQPVHARLVKIDDPLTGIIVSIDVLSDPRHWAVVEP